MAIKLQCVLVIIAILCASGVQAKTASEVFEKVSPSIVVIKAYVSKGKGKQGSGVVLEDGIVVTNCHVVEKAATIQVVRQEINYPATLLYSDWDRDVCSLSVGGFKGQAVTKGSTSRIKVGDKVYSIGAPKGLELTLSDGLISSLHPLSDGQYLQITAPISPGSSGGGLFDDEGRLIGLTTSSLREGQQLNFALPVEWINELPKRNAPLPKAKMTPPVEWVKKSIELTKKKDWPRLIKHGLRFTKAKPKDADSWHVLGFAYMNSNQPTKAIEAFQKAVIINPKYTYAWNGLGASYTLSGQADKAIEVYQQAILINPEDPDLLSGLGFAYSEAGQPSKAIETYQEAIRINPENANSWSSLGSTYIVSGQTDNAIAAYLQAARIKPDDALNWQDLGSCYVTLGQIDKAIESFKQALRINPKLADAWSGLGIAYKRSGQANEVMEVYKRLKILDSAKADQFYNKVVSP